MVAAMKAKQVVAPIRSAMPSNLFWSGREEAVSGMNLGGGFASETRKGKRRLLRLSYKPLRR
jgi:hypothetical protein